MGNANGRIDVDFEEEVNLSHFRLLRVVGRGAFGKVRIVERLDTKRLFALKYISKNECIKMDAIRNIFRERAMLEELDHPLDGWGSEIPLEQENLYRRCNSILDSRACLCYKISTFKRDCPQYKLPFIPIRDIKPDNVLLDDRGHVHLTDFNIATHIRSDKPLTSHSGTCAYMAPEVFRGGGYGVTVDWWSLGVTFYECIYGRKMIVKAPIQYPDMDPPVSPACVSAIQGFLERDINRRLGCGPNGFIHIQSHPFFRNIDWPSLESKAVQPIFRPSSDRINFDATYDLEELLLEEQPLEAKSRRRKIKKRKEGGAEVLSDKELQLLQIEEKFKPFDYTVFERYEGWVDPVTRCVGDPPEWVKPAAVEVENIRERESQELQNNSRNNSRPVSIVGTLGIPLDNGVQV
ncbi:8914_t:CDS:2 [Ambispora leptoticha]|uniref:8914_t:CDS:1 n=1 Tax=Ambispora leptoticha TaxID=144679 RepID=A0A9N9BCK4_9GLOM|nr:8914_t:CDS:2 [Ambispora leptoticha]